MTIDLCDVFQITLEVTDGWYSVKAVIDDALERLVHSGKLRIGYKVIVHGCELIGSSEACSPLEVRNGHTALQKSQLLYRISSPTCSFFRHQLIFF